MGKSIWRYNFVTCCIAVAVFLFAPSPSHAQWMDDIIRNIAPPSDDMMRQLDSPYPSLRQRAVPEPDDLWDYQIPGLIQEYSEIFDGDRIAAELCVLGNEQQLRERLKQLEMQYADIEFCPTIGSIDCPGRGCPLGFVPMQPKM
jgi:hypothetical protein